ncbi:MAG: hypothetical protein AB7T59_17310 [Hyphomonadaceae bacterium]
MASDSLIEALDRLEAALEAGDGADPDAAAEDLADAVEAFDAAAKEALR